MYPVQIRAENEKASEEARANPPASPRNIQSTQAITQQTKPITPIILTTAIMVVKGAMLSLRLPKLLAAVEAEAAVLTSEMAIAHTICSLFTLISLHRG